MQDPDEGLAEPDTEGGVDDRVDGAVELAQQGDGNVQGKRDTAAPAVGQHVGQEDKQPVDSDGEVAQPGDGAIHGRRDPAAPAVSQHVGQEDELFGDLGFFIQATKSLEEISESVCQMSDAQKYHLLRNHDRPSKHLVAAKGHSSTNSWRNMAGGWCTVGNLMVHSVCAVLYF